MKNLSTLPRFFRSPHTLAKMSGDEPVLVALSGGADSVTLLRLMKLYGDRTGCKVYAAHLNHGIRTESYGNEADRDERFCRELCSSLGIELFVKRADLPALSSLSGKSLETAARDERYGFFSEIMSEKKIKILATAHNADDNLETLIFNLARGSGVDGMCGIPEARPMDGVDGVVGVVGVDGVVGVIGGMAVRPILSASKREILEFCEQSGIEYMTDSTNLEDDCTRNRIRHIIIPELEALFGSPQRAAMRLSRSAREECEMLNEQTEQFMRMYCERGGDNINARGLFVTAKLDAFEKLPAAMKKRVLAALFKKYFNNTLEAVHINALTDLCESKSSSALCALPNENYAYLSSGRLVFSDRKPEKKEYDNVRIKLEENSSVVCPPLFAVTLGCAEPPCGYELYGQAYLKSAEGLYVRFREEGDKIFDNGIHKKLKKLLCDKRIPEEYRDILPVVCRKEEIIYVPKCALADGEKECGRTDVRVYIKKQKNFFDR